MRVDPKRLTMIGTGAALGVFVFCFKTSFLDPEKNLSALVATVFAVLAGFLSVALNAVSVERSQEFRTLSAARRYRALMRRRLQRHNALFYCYLSILLCVFFSELFLSRWHFLGRLFESLYLSLAASALVWSFSIPGTIAQLHDEATQLAKRAASNEQAGERNDV